jgi:hypothetical protein
MKTTELKQMVKDHANIMNHIYHGRGSYDLEKMASKLELNYILKTGKQIHEDELHKQELKKFDNINQIIM